MKLVKAIDGQGQRLVAIWEDSVLKPLMNQGQWLTDLSEILEHSQPAAFAASLAGSATTPLTQVTLLAPIDQQEVWAAGVTYKRSQTARMEESEVAADCYDRVYRSARPELFFKASPSRVSGPN